MDLNQVINDLREKLAKAESERDALSAQNNALRIALDDILEDMQLGAELNAEDCALWKTKIMLLLSKSPQHHLAAHDAEVAAKAVLDYNLELRKDIDLKMPLRCIGVHGDEYAAKLITKAGE